MAGLRRDIAAIAAFYGPELARARANRPALGPIARLRLRLIDRATTTESMRA